jgi:putative addiction module component (TIGR02574 family)
MTKNEILSELMKLDAQERLQIAEELWDSVGEEHLPLTEHQAAELQRRMDDLEANPSIGVPWEEVRASLLKKFG